MVEVIWKLKEGKSLALDLESDIRQVQAVLRRLQTKKGNPQVLHIREATDKAAQGSASLSQIEVERLRHLFDVAINAIMSGQRDARALFEKQAAVWRKRNLERHNVASIKEVLGLLRALLHQQRLKMFGIPRIFQTETPPDVFMMRFFLKGMVLFGLFYVPYMAFVDVPKYYRRYQDELTSMDFTPTTLYQGLLDSFLVRYPTRDWSAWEDEWMWMSIYFNLGCWSSIMLMLAPGRLIHQKELKVQAATNVSPHSLHND